MHFTRMLQFYKHRIRVPGSLFQGKNKAIPHISVTAKRRALNRLLVEQDNLEILSKPFLTKEETHGHTRERKKEQFKQIVLKSQAKRMLPNKYISEHLDHLNVEKKWE